MEVGEEVLLFLGLHILIFKRATLILEVSSSLAGLSFTGMKLAASTVLERLVAQPGHRQLTISFWPYFITLGCFGICNIVIRHGPTSGQEGQRIFVLAFIYWAGDL